MLAKKTHSLLYVISLHSITRVLSQTTQVKRWMAEQVWTAKQIKCLLKSNPKQQQELRYYKASFSEVFLYTWLSSWAEVQKYQRCPIFFPKEISCLNNVHLVHCIETDDHLSPWTLFFRSDLSAQSYTKGFFFSFFLEESWKQICKLQTKISQKAERAYLSSALFTPVISPHFMMCTKECTKDNNSPTVKWQKKSAASAEAQLGHLLHLCGDGRTETLKKTSAPIKASQIVLLDRKVCT